MDMPTASEAKRLEFDLYSNEPAYYGTREEIDAVKPVERSSIRDIINYFKEFFNIEPNFRNSTTTVGKLPTERDAHGRITRKTFGLYDKTTGLKVYDRSVLPQLRDPEREEIYEAGLLKQSSKDVATHENIHHVQNIFGAIKNYVKKFGQKYRDMVEGMATTMTKYVLGRPQPVYVTQQVEAEKDIRRLGHKRAFLGR